MKDEESSNHGNEDLGIGGGGLTFERSGPMEFEHSGVGLQGLNAEMEFAGSAAGTGFVDLNDADGSGSALAGECSSVEDEVVGER